MDDPLLAATPGKRRALERPYCRLRANFATGEYDTAALSRAIEAADIVRRGGPGVYASLPPVAPPDTSWLLSLADEIDATWRRGLDEMAKVEAHGACLRALAALRIYRKRHGADAATLDDLAPGVLESVPVDPFTGGPLSMIRENGMIVIYTVGVGGVDDGGAVTNEARMGTTSECWDWGYAIPGKVDPDEVLPPK